MTEAMPGTGLATRLRLAGPEDAEVVAAIVHAAFEARPPLDPPATALSETVDTVRAALAAAGGLLAFLGDEPVGTLLFADEGRFLRLRRVGVLAEDRRHGLGPALAARAAEVALERGYAGLVLEARAELPRTVAFWQHRGYAETGRAGTSLTLHRLLPRTLTLPDAADTREIGRRLATLLRAGDLVLLTGDLGAGKTTLTQGLGDGLGVRGAVTSPTFVIARVHPPTGVGPALVHVDAYRLGDALELDDLDLDTDLDTAVTVVEWGAGLAESLAADRLELALTRADDDVRTLTVTGVGRRWRDVDLGTALAGG